MKIDLKINYGISLHLRMVIIEIKKGDLLKANESYICQQCNCVTIKSHGLSKSIGDKYSYGDPYKNRPKKTPNTNDIKTATNPIEIEILEPIRSLLNKSRPYLSVPKRNCFLIK